MANAVANKQQTGITTYLTNDAVKRNVMSVVGEKNTTKFISSVISAVQANPTLSECTNGSILSAALLGEALQLSPSPQLGQFYMVPYKNKNGTTEAQFQLGAKGYKQLAIRSGQYKRIVTSVVKEGELKAFNPITEEYIFEPIMDVATREKQPVIGYYASFELLNGFKKEIYWSKERMMEHAKKYSNGYRKDLQKNTSYTFWARDFDSMAEKTMIRQLISKWGIMSIEMQKAYEGDMGVIQEDGSVRYVDNETDIREQVKEEIAENANSTPIVIEGETVLTEDVTEFE